MPPGDVSALEPGMQGAVNGAFSRMASGPSATLAVEGPTRPWKGSEQRCVKKWKGRDFAGGADPKEAGDGTQTGTRDGWSEGSDVRLDLST